MTQPELIELVYVALDEPRAISGLDAVSGSREIRFNWRGHRYRVADSLMVERIEGRMLISDDLAALMELVLKRTREAKGLLV